MFSKASINLANLGKAIKCCLICIRMIEVVKKVHGVAHRNQMWTVFCTAGQNNKAINQTWLQTVWGRRADNVKSCD